MIRVIKVGGSLFDWPRLPRALDWCLAQQSPAVNVLIAGGGAVADVIRDADERFNLGPERSHWLCIEAMSMTGQVLAAIVPQCRQVADFLELKELIRSQESSAVVFDAREF